MSRIYRFHPYGARRCLVLIAAAALLALLSYAPASAIVQPRIYDWQLRLSKRLPDKVKEEANRLAGEMGLQATPEQISQAAAELPCSSERKPAELYLGIKVLLAMDRSVRAAEHRLLQTNQAIAVCSQYLKRIDRYRRGKKMRRPNVAEAEQLPQPLRTSEWQTRLQLPEWDESCSANEISDCRNKAAELQSMLEAEREGLKDEIKTLSAPSHELQKYVLQLCDSLDPLTCKPYLKPPGSLNIIPPPPTDTRPLQL
ncbi:hypothetical protein IJT17_07225 [bacterium]|nr:hypothetical protein [bacterium]